MRWAGHVARMEEGRSVFKILKERDLYGGLGVDGRTILEWTLKRCDQCVELSLFGSG